MITCKFIVENQTFEFDGETIGDAMTKCNRQVIDKLDLHPMAWMDTGNPYVFRMTSGNFYD